MKRFFKFALVALATAAVAVACQKPEQQPEKIALKGISLNKEAVELAIGAKETLTVKLDPANVTEKPTIEWSSSAPAVATVAEGEVTAVAAGEATITAKAGSFTATCKVTVKGEEQPEPAVPKVASWAEAEAAGAIHFFQFRAGANWSPKIYEDLEGDAEDFDNLTVANGVYTVSYEEGSNERWQSQFYMRPNPEKATLPLKAGKNYLVSLTFKANTTFGAFAKLTTYGDVAPKHEGARIKEWESVMLEANTEKTVAYVVEGVDCDNVNFVLDFGTHPENTTVEISNVKLEETDLPVGPVGDDTSGPIDINWDYTPSAEYLAESNLWKAVDGDKVGFYYIYEAAGYPAAASDSYELLSFKESTYVLDCKAATESTWANQLFIFPKEGNFIPLDPAKTYRVKITVCSNADYYGPFIKLCTYNPETANHEGAEMWALTGWPELITFKAGEPIIKEVELTGKEAQNIIWVMGLGGNPKDAKIYIKDIIVEEVGGEVPPVVDAPESDVITVDILPTAYPSEETVVKNGDIEYNILLVANYGNGIQMKKQDSYISNKTAFKNIKTIKVTTATSKTLYPENLKLCAGTSENPTTEIPMKSGDSETAVWELDGEYTYFKLQNVSGYAVYLSKIEINPASDPAPTGIKIDGDFSDWAGIDGATTENNRITLWKASSDADNIYFYYEITASKVKTSGANFDWSPYIYIGLDTDNNSSTGDAAGGGTTIAGCEVQVCTFPWRGDNTLGSGTEEVFDTSKHSFVNGEDKNGWVKYPVSGSSAAFPVVYGKIDGSICYIELSIPRSAIGSPTGTISVESAMDWYPTGIGTVTLN